MTQHIKQHNVITEARYDMSALEKNIIYLLIRELDEKDLPGKQYTVDLAEIESVMGLITKEVIDEAVVNLISRSYTIKEPEGSVLIVTLMTVVLRDLDSKKLHIKISRNILPYYIDLKHNYTELELHIALSLKNKYSKRLYGTLIQYKEIGNFHVSVQELKRRLSLNKEGKQEELYAQFATFRRSVLELAQKELEEYADINFTYEAKKTGRSYTDLIFYIKQVEKPIRD